MELKTPPPPERFLRGKQKRQRPSRRLGRPILRTLAVLVGLVGLVAVFVWTATAAGSAPELAVNRVLVEGNVQLSDGEILELLELSEGSNILLLNLEDVRARLLRSAWVSGVEIERVLPRTLTLQITEREPVALAVLDELYLLAADGTILDQLSPQYDIEELVLVRGLRDRAGLVPESARLAGRLAAALLEERRISRLVSEIDVARGADSVSLYVREPAVRVVVDGETMMERLEVLLPLLSGIQGRFARLDVVDLRFDGRVYLRVRERAGSSPRPISPLEVRHSE